MDRRHFSSLLGALGLLSVRSFASAPGGDGMAPPEQLHLSRNGWMPNNERLPVLLYRQALRVEGEQDPAILLEDAFRRNGWPPQWRNGVYDFHHYHSTAHEVLGFAGGQARLMLGGENGQELTVHAGDVLVLPTGTGHRKLEASSGFLVVGAYPPQQNWDICRSAPSDEAVERMRHLPFPGSDPMGGANGALVKLWHSA